MSSRVGARTKGYIKNLNTGVIKRFQYNPETFEYSRGVTYAEIVAPGMSYPNTQFVHGNTRTFSVELFFFDKPCTGVINSYMNFIGGFLTPETNSANYKKPPEMLFCYGTFIRRCVLDDLSIKMEEYDPWGRPTMARFTLTLRQVGV